MISILLEFYSAEEPLIWKIINLSKRFVVKQNFAAPACSAAACSMCTWSDHMASLIDRFDQVYIF